MQHSISLRASAMTLALLTSAASAWADDIKQPTSGIIISKVFYAGTTQVGSNKNYTGGEEYIELYNNTDQPYDLAGLGIGLVESESGTGAYLAGDITSPAYGVALKQLYQIPTTQQVVVEPYSTLLIAACAIDHSALAEGGADLSQADFEFGGMDGDNPDVPNLELLFSFNEATKAVNLTNGGDAGLIIFPAKYMGDKIAVTDANIVYANGKEKGSQYLKVNAYYSMDAVEILKTKATDGTYAADAARKRFAETIDKGYVAADQKMNKDGYVAYRRTALSAPDRCILFDTGNSTTDFQVSSAIAPRAYDATPSGYTEVTVTVPESGFLPYCPDQYFYTGGDLYIGYVNISGGTVKCNSYAGNSVIASNSPYLLIGAPGDHTVYLTEAQRTLATSGVLNWLTADNEAYDAVSHTYIYTGNAKRYPMKYVGEKGNVRFVRDLVDGQQKSMHIDLDTESPLYINVNYWNDDETEIRWTGTMPEDVITGISEVVVPEATQGGQTYNVMGQRVAEGYRGLVVRGGKVTLVK